MGDFRPQFYLRPKTPGAASKLLQKYGRSSMVIGGGTEIYELAQRGLLSGIKALVDISGLSLDGFKAERQHTFMGASVTLSQLEENKNLYSNGRLGCLRDALSEIRPLQVKNLATVGGAISSCVPFFDLPVALAALDADVEVNGARGARTMGLLDFQKDFLQPNLRRGEFVRGIRIPRQNLSRPSAFSKFAETGDDWAIVNCACALDVSRGAVEDARIVFGAISNRLFVAKEAAKALRGREPRTEMLRKAEEALARELPELNSDHRASASYRKRLAKVLLASTIERALARSEGAGA